MNTNFFILHLAMGGGRGMNSHQPYVPEHGDGSYHDGYGAPRGGPPAYDPYMQQHPANEP